MVPVLNNIGTDVSCVGVRTMALVSRETTTDKYFRTMTSTSV